MRTLLAYLSGAQLEASAEISELTQEASLWGSEELLDFSILSPKLTGSKVNERSMSVTVSYLQRRSILCNLTPFLVIKQSIQEYDGQVIMDFQWIFILVLLEFRLNSANTHRLRYDLQNPMSIHHIINGKVEPHLIVLRPSFFIR